MLSAGYSGSEEKRISGEGVDDKHKSKGLKDVKKKALRCKNTAKV